MSEEQMNSYRLTSMEEPGDERMAQIMREVAEDARESTRRAAERVASEHKPVLTVIAGPKGSGKTPITPKAINLSFAK